MSGAAAVTWDLETAADIDRPVAPRGIAAGEKWRPG